MRTFFLQPVHDLVSALEQLLLDTPRPARAAALALLGLFTPLLWGMWFRAPTVAVIYVLLAIMSFFMAFWYVRKQPAS